MLIILKALKTLRIRRVINLLHLEARLSRVPSASEKLLSQLATIWGSWDMTIKVYLSLLFNRACQKDAAVAMSREAVGSSRIRILAF